MPRPTERLLLAAATGADGRIYAIGGNENLSSGPTNRVDAYDPSTNTWSTVTPMPTPRQGLAAARGPDGTLYALGGNNNDFVRLSTAEAYDPSTNTWRVIAPMPTARRDLAAAPGIVGGIGRIYTFGGHSVLPPFNTVEVYTP